MAEKVFLCPPGPGSGSSGSRNWNFQVQGDPTSLVIWTVAWKACIKSYESYMKVTLQS